MTCDEIREDLGAYLDGELDPARRSELDSHLAACAECRGELERLRRLGELVRALPRARAPEGLARRIVAASRCRTLWALSARSWRMWTGALGAAAAIALAAVVGLTVTREGLRGPAAERAAPAFLVPPAEKVPIATSPAPEGDLAEQPAPPSVGIGDHEEKREAADAGVPERPGTGRSGVGAGAPASGPAGFDLSQAGLEHAAPARNAAPSIPVPAARRGDEVLLGAREEAAADELVPPEGPSPGALPESALAEAPEVEASPGGRALAGAPRALDETSVRDRKKAGPVPTTGAEGGPRAAGGAAEVPAEPEISFFVHLKAHDPAAELARVEAIAVGCGGGLLASSTRAETAGIRGAADRVARLRGGELHEADRRLDRKTARDGPPAAEGAPARPEEVRATARVPFERLGEFLASVERLTLEDAESREARGPAGGAAPPEGGVVASARRAVQQAEPARWVLVEIAIEREAAPATTPPAVRQPDSGPR